MAVFDLSKLEFLSPPDEPDPTRLLWPGLFVVFMVKTKDDVQALHEHIALGAVNAKQKLVEVSLNSCTLDEVRGPAVKEGRGLVYGRPKWHEDGDLRVLVNDLPEQKDRDGLVKVEWVLRFVGLRLPGDRPQHVKLTDRSDALSIGVETEIDDWLRVVERNPFSGSLWSCIRFNRLERVKSKNGHRWREVGSADAQG